MSSKNDKKFIITKNAKTDQITYMEYEKIKGLNFNPKKNVKYDNMINVNQMIIINPSFIEKIIDRKCKKHLESILKMLSIIFESDDESGDALEIALDELEKFKSIVRNRYAEYMDKKKYDLLLKKIEILENETKLRKQYIVNKAYVEEQGKGR